MRWSRVKKIAEGLLAESLRGRVAYHLVRYGPGMSNLTLRGSVTLDKREIFSASTLDWVRRYQALTYEIQLSTGSADLTEASRDAAYTQAASMCRSEGTFSRDDFLDAVQGYASLTLDAALVSPDPITRALAMFDRRLGKRRLREALPQMDAEHPLVRQFYQVRCEAEGLLVGYPRAG